MPKMKLPYGHADFYSLITDGYYYIDRTNYSSPSLDVNECNYCCFPVMENKQGSCTNQLGLLYIRLLEDKGRTLLFLRPRRFGKSLLISMLENYYDLNKASAFEQLFGHLAIGQNPTSLHNRSLILKWNFSAVEPHGTSDQIKQSLYNHINYAVGLCAEKYAAYLTQQVIIDPIDGLNSVQSLLKAVVQTPYRLYLLIDEYDNFANEVLTAGQLDSKERYQDLVEGEGMIKTLFKVVKYGLEGNGLERVFLTGVSPVVVHDITSGFNIVENITHETTLHDLCGFHEVEVRQCLDHIALGCGFSQAQTEEAMRMMQTFYNGYRFSLDEETRLYNPTLVFYFLKYLQQHCRYPQKILDNNLATDQHKIRYVAHIPQGEQIIATIANEIDPLVIPELSERFGIYNILYGDKDDPYMASLLYYLGVLTLGETTDFGERILIVPNLVVRKLYVEQLKEMLLPPGTTNEAYHVVRAFFREGAIGAVCDFIERRYLPVFANRDYRWLNELTIKTLFLTLLFDDSFYIVTSEHAVQHQYADVTLLVRPDMRKYTLWDFVFEFKRVPLAEMKCSGTEVRAMEQAALLACAPVQTALTEAHAQLANYRQALEKDTGEPMRLRCFSVVAIGYERLVWEEV